MTGLSGISSGSSSDGSSNSKVELTLYAVNLVGGAFHQGTNPYAIVTILPNDPREQPQILGKTEIIKNAQNPRWTTSFQLDYELGRNIRINVGLYNASNKQKESTENKPLGSAVFEIGEILASRGNVKAKKLRAGGALYVRVAPTRKESSGMLHLTLSGIDLHNVDGIFGKPSPFIEISKQVELPGGLSWQVVYRSNPVQQTLNPQWEPIVIDLNRLCEGNLLAPVAINCWDFERSGKNRPMGRCETNVQGLISAAEGSCHPGFILLGRAGSKGIGHIVVKSATVVNAIGRSHTPPPTTQKSLDPPVPPSPATAVLPASHDNSHIPAVSDTPIPFSLALDHPPPQFSSQLDGNSLGAVVSQPSEPEQQQVEMLPPPKQEQIFTDSSHVSNTGFDHQNNSSPAQPYVYSSSTLEPRAEHQITSTTAQPYVYSSGTSETRTDDTSATAPAQPYVYSSSTSETRTDDTWATAPIEFDIPPPMELEEVPAMIPPTIAPPPNERPSFVEYLSGGLELSLSVGIDFTGSNGDPRVPGTLHYIDRDGQLNDYEKAITAVGSIIARYDSDQKIAAYGFGAKMGGKSGIVQHCFQLGHEPELWRIGGVLNAYREVFHKGIVMSGPTVFTEVIDLVAEITRSRQEYFRSIGKQAYHVLLILTDGEVSDIEATKASIVRAQDAPLSIVIVGIGQADFSAMHFLDNLHNTDGVGRDICKFVEFSKYKDNRAALTQETLHEIPDQLVEYFVSHGIRPLPPLSGSQINLTADEADDEDVDLAFHVSPTGEMTLDSHHGPVYDETKYDTMQKYENSHQSNVSINPPVPFNTYQPSLLQQPQSSAPDTSQPYVPQFAMSSAPSILESSGPKPYQPYVPHQLTSSVPPISSHASIPGTHQPYVPQQTTPSAPTMQRLTSSAPTMAPHSSTTSSYQPYTPQLAQFSAPLSPQPYCPPLQSTSMPHPYVPSMSSTGTAASVPGNTPYVPSSNGSTAPTNGHQGGPPLAVATARRLFQVQCPPGSTTGTQLQVTNPFTGQAMLVTVPPGVVPGGLFMVQY